MNSYARRAAAIVLVLLLAVPFSVPSGIGGFVLERLLTLWMAASSGVAVVAACVGLGLLCVPADVLRSERLLGALLALGAGAGLLSCVVLVLGFLPTGTFGRGLGWSVVLVCIAAGAVRVWQISRVTRSELPLAPPDQPARALHWPTILLLVCGIVLLAISALAPPLMFDVTEYHLGALRDNSSVGKSGALALQWGHVRNNFYGRFPFPIESLYWLGVLLAWPVDVAPKVINAAFVMACLLLIFCGARKSAGRAAGLLAALLVVSHPVMREVSLDAFIDAPTAFLVAATVFGALWLPLESMPLVGLLFGTALASKYTVMQLYLLPTALLVVVVRGREWRVAPSGRMGSMAFTAAAALLPLMFWLGKNVYLYGNPLEPFFVSLFRPGDAAGIAAEKFYIASHFPQPLWTAGYWTSLAPRLGSFGWMLLPLAAGALVLHPRERRVRDHTGPLLLFAVTSYLLWNLVRESQARFLLPAIMVVIYLAAVATETVQNGYARCVARLALLLVASLQLFHQALTIANAGELAYLRDYDPAADHAPTFARVNEAPITVHTAREDFYASNLGALGEVLPACNRLPTNAKVLLVYEARAYLFSPAVAYNTVWDESELLRIAGDARNTSDVARLLRDAGITHVLVNRQELRRYIQQYARPEQLRALGIRASQDPGDAFYATQTPEDLFPPFYRDARWPACRQAVIRWLADCRKNATASKGSAPLDVFLAEVK
jgi:hypothetical protein